MHHIAGGHKIRPYTSMQRIDTITNKGAANDVGNNSFAYLVDPALPASRGDNSRDPAVRAMLDEALLGVTSRGERAPLDESTLFHVLTWETVQ